MCKQAPVTNPVSSNGNNSNDSLYPSAVKMADFCLSDYQRLLDEYNKLYDKVNIALAFSGVVLTLTFSTFSFESFSLLVGSLMLWKLIILIFRIACQCGSMLLIMVSTICFLGLLTGKRIPVFKSEDIRNEKIYSENEDIAAVWLIDKFTKITNEMRVIIQEKQRKFDKSLMFMMIGLIMYAATILLEKGGF